MSKRSVWKNGPDGRTIRRNKIATQFAWLSIAALESPAYRALSLSGHRVIARIQIEHAHHGGRENGKLPVTFQDFDDFGIHRHAIAPAVREAQALGFIRITRHGRAGNAEFRNPNMFALTHLPTENGQKAATDDWRRIKTIEEATAIATAARKAPARYGRFSRKSASPQKRNPVPETAPSLGAETTPRLTKSSVRKPHYKAVAETALLSKSWGGGRGGESKYESRAAANGGGNAAVPTLLSLVRARNGGGQ